MAIQSWQSIIDLVRNGEPVTAEVANRAIGQLVSRTEHLKVRQDAQSLAQAIFITGAPITSSVKTGHAVYFDVGANKFAPAYATLEFKNGVVQPGIAAAVVGVVIYKDTLESGVIAIEGWLDPDQYDDVDCQFVPMLSNMLLDPADRGILYLCSGQLNAGKLSSKPGLLNAPVCNLVSPTNLLIRPPVIATLETQALKFKLNNKVAGADIVFNRVSGTTPFVFVNPPAVGSKVRVYLANSATATSGNPTADEATVYLTGTVLRYNASNNQVQINDITMTEYLVKALATAQGSYATVFGPVAAGDIRMKVVGAVTGHVLATGAVGTACYASPITFDAGLGWVLNTLLLDSNLPGWLPVANEVFNNSTIPAGARYGYNVKKDTTLQQLFPEDIVTAYIVTKDGVGLSNQVVVVNQSGIWWMDSLAQVPWHTVNNNNILPEVQITLATWLGSEVSQLIMPSELHLVYAKLVTGGVKVVTSLETAPDSGITILDPQGNQASSGPLVLRAGFAVTDASSTETGSLVVKDITGFAMKRGRVVERIAVGNNLALTSTHLGGQGEVTLSIVGLDGKLEGQPDILAIDDILVEKDLTLNIFYSVFPKGKASSILGKIDVPSYLAAGTYRVELNCTFIALHTSGAIQAPDLSLTWVSLLDPTTKFNLSACTQSAAAIVVTPYASPVYPRECFRKVTNLLTVYPNSSVYFKLARAASDAYPTKFAIAAISYKFVKI